MLPAASQRLPQTRWTRREHRGFSCDPPARGAGGYEPLNVRVLSPASGALVGNILLSRCRRAVGVSGRRPRVTHVSHKTGLPARRCLAECVAFRGITFGVGALSSAPASKRGRSAVAGGTGLRAVIGQESLELRGLLSHLQPVRLPLRSGIPRNIGPGPGTGRHHVAGIERRRRTPVRSTFILLATRDRARECQLSGPVTRRSRSEPGSPAEWQAVDLLRSLALADGDSGRDGCDLRCSGYG